MKMSDILLESEQLDEAPVGTLQQIGNRVAGFFGSGKHQGAATVGKEANQLRKELDAWMSRSGIGENELTPANLLVFLTKKGYKDYAKNVIRTVAPKAPPPAKPYKWSPPGTKITPDTKLSDIGPVGPTEELDEAMAPLSMQQIDSVLLKVVQAKHRAETFGRKKPATAPTGAPVAQPNVRTVPASRGTSTRTSTPTSAAPTSSSAPAKMSYAEVRDAIGLLDKKSKQRLLMYLQKQLGVTPTAPTPKKKAPAPSPAPAPKP